MSKYTIIIEDDEKCSSIVNVEFIQEFDLCLTPSLSQLHGTLAGKIRNVVFPMIENVCKEMIQRGDKNES